MLNIKKIIKEEVSLFIMKEKFKNDISFLNDFNFVSFSTTDEGENKWLFEKGWKENFLIIKISNKNNNWELSIDYENQYSKEIGSDITWTFIGNYNDFIEFVSNKLNNHPFINSNLLINDLESLEETEILNGIKRVMDKKENIEKLKCGYLDDLKKLLSLLKSMSQITNKEKILKILKDTYRTYRPIIMILNKVDMVDYYINLQNNTLTHE